jgi:hypothetical protein
MKNRKAWGLVVVLAMVVLVGVGVMGKHYQRLLLGQQHSIALLQPREWGFERYGFALVNGTTVLKYEDCYRCGFFVVQVKRPPPAAVLKLLPKGAGQASH